MLSNEVKKLVEEVIELYSNAPLNQNIINSGKEKILNAIELLKNSNKEEKILHKVVLAHPYTYTEKVLDTFPNCRNGQISPQTKYCSTQYLDIEEYEYLELHQNLAYNRGNFYDKNKNFIKGYSQNDYQSGEKMIIPSNAKYFVGGSDSSGTLPVIYGFTYNKPQEIQFAHESNKTYEVNNVTELKQGNYKIGDIVTTKGYSLNGDLGDATYEIVSEAEYIHLMKKNSFVPSAKTQVDGYGNHLLNNGLVARLIIDNDDMRPEQWGAKGDGVTNDCQALTHMFAKITSGTVTFKEGATYLLGLYGGSIENVEDNPYRVFGCGSLLGGQKFSKPILITAHDLKINGNNCLITIPDNCFGNSGMGILNFSGHLKNVDIFNFRFDGKGRTLSSPNKNSNHTLFYSACNAPEDETTLSIHPVGNGEKRSCIENLNIYNNFFFDAGAMYRTAGDWGGDHILIVNPTELDGLNIHNNRFEAWGRWVFAIDLGGYGECLKNIKFNNNICIGANAYEETNEDGTPKYLIGLDKKEFLKLSPNYNENVLSIQLENWRWRALGFIDFEARKCFDNVSIQRNYIQGAVGWAINGASRITQNVIVKDNYWHHCGGGYPYTLEFYSGEAKNWIIDNNDFVVKPGIKLGLNTNNIKITNNKNIAVRFLGLQGNIDIENNETDYGFNIDSMNAPTYLTEEERNVNLIFKNNRAGINGNLNFPFIHYDFSGNTIDGINLIDFTTHSDIGPSNQIVNTNPNYLQHFHAFGFRFTSPMEKPSIGSYWKSGDIIHESTKNFSLVNSGFYKNLIDNFSKYNWNFTNYINQKGLKDIKMLCTEDGIVPGVGAWGFNNQLTGWSDAEGKKFQDKSYVYTEDNLYYIEKAGVLDINNKPTHTEGVSICGECELQWIDKIAKVKLIEII